MASDIYIQYTPVRSKIITPLPVEAETALYESLRYHPENYFYATRYQSNQWDGYTECYSKVTHSFRSGLIQRVVRLLQDLGYIVTVSNQPSLLSIKSVDTIPYLRTWQRDAIRKVLEYGRCGIWAPPRSGKTVFACGLVDVLQLYPVVYFCERLEIAQQVPEKFLLFTPNISVGVVGNGEVTIGEVTVMTVQSAMAAYGNHHKRSKDEEEEKEPRDKKAVRDLIESARVVIYDEYHHVAHASGQFIMGKIRQASCIVGLSATPWRDDNANLLLERAVGPVGYQVTYSHLIDCGLLVRPHIYMYKLPKASGDGGKAYQTLYKEYIVENAFRNLVIARVTVEFQRLRWPNIVLVDFIKHGNILHDIIPNSLIVTGQDRMSWRKQVMELVNDGCTDTIITTLWGEGVDVPPLRAVVLAGGGESSIETFQHLRSITPYDGKDCGVVVDFFDDARYLRRHSKARKRFYLSEKEFRVFDVNVTGLSQDDIQGGIDGTDSSNENVIGEVLAIGEDVG